MVRWVRSSVVGRRSSKVGSQAVAQLSTVVRASSGKAVSGRPGLQQALELVRAYGEDAVLVVAKLDRLSRSMKDFASLMNVSERQGWGLVALDLGVDTSTPSGEMMANILATFAQFERRLIGQRTKDALAVKKTEGVKLGRPRRTTDHVLETVRSLRAEGLSFAAIANRLTEEGVPTSQGGKRWYPSTVKKLTEAKG